MAHLESSIKRCAGGMARLVAGAALLAIVYVPAAHADLLVGGGSGILRFHERTGQFLGVAVDPGALGLDNPQGTAIGPDGRLYISSFGDPRPGVGEHRQILRYDGREVEVFVPPASGGLGAPDDVAFGPDGNLYVADGFFGTNSILRFNGTSGRFMGVFARSSEIRQPSRIAFGRNGDLYVGNANSSDVLRFHGTTGLPYPAPGRGGAVFVSGTPGPYNTIITVAPDGSLLVSSGAAPGIRRYDQRTGAFLGVVVAGITVIGDMTFGPDGNLYVTDYQGNAIRRYRGLTGQFLGEFVQAGAGGLLRPNTIAFTCTPWHGKGHRHHCRTSSPRDTGPKDENPEGVFRIPF